jgi:carbonic anhydrase/acetyltransferase-like protein (isoleucine patch superfamily)
MIRSLDGKSPRVHESAFVSEAAYVVGDVEVGAGSSIWPGAVIRADSGRIVIGARTNVQDNCTLHGDADVWIGDDVTIGHGVVCHAKLIGGHSLIGNGAVLNDGVETGEWCLVAAGAVVPENVVIPARSIVRGVPGKVIGEVLDRHVAMMKYAAEAYVERVARYRSAGL